ncbi:hypothetical protein Ahy_Scaffold1g107304 isoform J [Arachis hypogaea]|uniref:Uncharacterized protein n=1 Tax=Arachis hypogaea TaxID=3818 RepID=A0A444WV85_ARAHY|nr:hypothetical protein Ahy_Scaffold1g107304 isoform J [Arachis hypogaea]
MLCAMLEKCHHQRNFRCIIKKSKFMVPKVIKQGKMDGAFVHQTMDKWPSSNLVYSGYSLKAALMVNYDLAGPSFCPP